MTAGVGDPVVVLARLRGTYLRRRAGALDRAAKYRQRPEMQAAAHFADGQALAYSQAVLALDQAIGSLEDLQEVMNTNGS